MMDTKNKLLNEKDKLLKQIASSAQHGDSQTVLSAGEKLKKIESLIDRHEKLLRDILDLCNETHSPQPLQNSQIISRLATNKGLRELDIVPGRGIGKTIRMDFLRRVSKDGVHLEHIKGSIYETKSGYKVGVAVATERKADRWFLGLPIKSFDNAILLCQKDDGDVMEICIPKNFFDEYGKKMSASGGQMKFNVSRRGNGYAILVPGTDGVNVSKFIGDYSLLK
jgi:hypothetical protein